MASVLFEIYQTNGTGLRRGPAFRDLEDALRHVNDHLGEYSFAIKRPDGNWHIGDDGKRAIFRRAERGVTGARRDYR